GLPSGQTRKEAAMRPAALHGLLILGLGGLTVLGQGGESPYEVVIKETLGALDKLAEALGTIKDQESATSARPEVRKAAGKLADVTKKAEKLKQPSKEEKDRVTKEYKAKLETAVKRLYGEIARVKGV